MATIDELAETLWISKICVNTWATRYERLGCDARRIEEFIIDEIDVWIRVAKTGPTKQVEKKGDEAFD